MSRIRTVKPEFWSSEQVMECSTNARLLFIGLWNFCDDAGRHPLTPKQIKALVFPADDFTTEDVRRMIDELSSNGLLVTYGVDGKEYLQVTGWQHQKIDRPQASRYPAPPEHSSNDQRALATYDDNDGKGREQVIEPQAQQTNAARLNLDELQERLFSTAGIAGFRDERHPKLLDLSPILALLEKNYDLERDILPIIQAKSRNKTFSTWGFFIDAIVEAAEKKRAIPALEQRTPIASWPLEKWQPLVAHWRQSGNWNRDALGPPPGEPGCLAPLELVSRAA